MEPGGYDAFYEAQRSAFLASVDAAAAAAWPGMWPQQIPEWIKRDEEPGSVGNFVATPLTPDEIIAHAGRRVPVSNRPWRSAMEHGARPLLLGFVRNDTLNASIPDREAFALLAAGGLPLFHTSIGRSAAIQYNMESLPIVLTDPEAPAAQQFRQLADEVRHRLAAERP